LENVFLLNKIRLKVLSTILEDLDSKNGVSWH